MASETNSSSNQSSIILDKCFLHFTDEILFNVLEGLLKGLKLDNTIILESCETLNTILIAQIRCNKNLVNTVIYEKIIEQSVSLLGSSVGIKKECCDLLIEIFGNCLLLIQADRKTEIVNEMIQNIDENLIEWTKQKQDSPDLINNGLHRFQCLLNLFENQKMKDPSSKIVLDNFQSLIYKFLKAIMSPKNLMTDVCLLVFPKILKIGDQQSVIEFIWSNLISSCNFENENVTTNDNLSHLLLILHGLSDHYLNCPESESFKIQYREEFWKILQAGIVNDEFILRKQALYLLKMALGYFKNSNKSFLQLAVFSWDATYKDTLVNFWETLIVILEVLEEKQVHLVTPVFPMVDELITNFSSTFKNGKTIDASWLLCIIRRILKHDSNTIIRLGIIKFTSLNVCLYCREGLYKKILIHFLRSLNDMFIFTSVEQESAAVDKALIIWFCKWSKCPHLTTIFNDILKCIMEISWGPIPLFFVTHAMSQIPPTPCLDKDSLYLIKRFVSDSLGTQNIFIRGAVQCRLLKSIYLLCKPENVSLIDIADLVSHFRSSESLLRGTPVWDACAAWIKSVFSKKDTENFLKICESVLSSNYSKSDSCSNVLSCPAMGKMFILLCDAELIDFEGTSTLLFAKIYECLNDCDKRLYSCINTQDLCLNFILHLLNGTVSQYNEQSLRKDMILNHIVNILPEAVKLIKMRMTSVPNECSIDSVDMYISILEIICEDKDFYGLVYSDLNVIETIASHALIDFSSSLLQIYFVTKVLYCLLKVKLRNSGDATKKECLQPIKNLIKKHLVEGSLNKQLKEMEDDSYKTGTQNSWGRLASGVIQGLWSIFDLFLSQNIVDSSEIFDNDYLKSIIRNGLEALSTGGRRSTIYVLSSFKYIFEKSKTEQEEVQEFFSTSWDACFELRKTELFWPSIKKWIEMVYQKSVLEREDCYFIILEYTGQLVQKGCKVVGLLNILLSQLQKISSSIDLRDFSGIIVDLMLFGPLKRKDHKVELETCKFILSLGSEYFTKELINDEYMDAEVRIKALDLVVSSTKNYDLVPSVVGEVISRNSEISQKNPRLYKDSELHRIKNRSLQVLLVLEALIYKNKIPDYEGLADKMLDFVLESLLAESQQPSIRYQLEWLFIRLAIHYDLGQGFWYEFDMAKTERVGSVCSFISIAFHIDRVLKDDKFFEMCVEHILPWCMAQHFCVRLFAQTVLQKLWEIHENISDKYDLIKLSQSRVFNQGNTMTNIKKLQIDFYFNAFHPMDHYSLQTIFWDLPRLANLASDEWVPLGVIDRSSTCEWDFIPKVSAHSGLSNCVTSTWALKGEDTIAEGGLDARGGIQKKFVPWLSSKLSNSEEKKYFRSGLVVVAALIDKPANLGGLARTCEVFSASCLVVPSLSLTHDKQFTSLSASAEKHLNITEVKPHNLNKYLLEMKKQGYMLVGAEQTSDSIPLSKFSFACQTVLLLGNEKEGIPVNLLPLLDICVEIPQFGLIRSLNVHVTGAIFFWEYAKQHRQLSNM